jgi:gliding motility-associated-like protein
MRLLKSLLFIWLFQPIIAFCQTEGWSNACLNITPKVVEAMIDACGNQEEFFREYVVFKTGSTPYNIHNLAYRVINPFNDAFVGSVKVEDLSTDPTIFQRLNDAVSTICDYGITFRDVLAAPYFGTVPQEATFLVFNNKDVDLDYLKSNVLPSLCGSKVFVALGSLKAQSPGVAIFRNFPKNRSCGNTACFRQIDFQYEGINAPFCEQLSYNFLKLPSPAIIRSGDEFGDGSYIRPKNSTTLDYGGGGPVGVNTACMPPEKLLCTVPPKPDFGNGVWNVSAYDDANFTNFKGFYQAKSGHDPSVSAPAGSFEYNTARDGWKPHQAPSEAHPTYGALTAYEGCNTKADNFSILAQRKGFPCGDYTLRLLKYDDHVLIRIDTDGDGVWDFDKPYTSPACSIGCNTDIWSGSLGANSKMQIFGIEQNLDFQTHLLFIKKNTSPTPLNITATTTPTPCGAAPSGGISLSVTGGNVATHSWNWTGPTPIANNSATANNLAAGFYAVFVKDANGCQDSARFLVSQTNTIVTTLGRDDTSFCAGGIASLRGFASGGAGPYTYEWTTAEGKLISNQAITTYTPYQNTELIFKATDASGCFQTSKMKVTINQLPYITIRSAIADTICNNTVFTMKASGANNFVWSANWDIALAGWIFTPRSPNNDSVYVNAFALPDPVYIYTVTGTDGNGCVNTAQKRFTLIPLPKVNIVSLSFPKVSFCNDDNPIKVTGTPYLGGSYYAIYAATGNPCVGCMTDTTFYPTIAGPGQFNIVHELVDPNGCVNRPSVYIEVKPCVVNPCPTTIVNLTAKTCDPTKVGVVTQNLKKLNGCDSTVITTTTLSLTDQTRLTATTCDPSVVGEKTVTLKNINGCDSLVITTYSLVPIINTPLTGTSCNPLDTGTFIKNLKGYLGCDSIVTTKITLLEKSTTRLTATTCDPSVVGEKTVTLKNINGCDSLVVTTYSLVPTINTVLTGTSCNPLDTGTFVKPFKGYLGCDSIVTTKIALLEKSTTRLTATTCDPSVVGEKTATLKNINGCDSLVITTYSLVPIINTPLTGTSCNPLDTGTFTKNLKGYLGCDSIVTTKITLLEKSTTRLTATTCDPSVVGEKTATLKNINGCDSLVITTYSLVPIINTPLTGTSCNPLDTGTFIKNLKGYLGCDSIVTTKITLLEKSITRLTATTCDPSAVGEKTVTLKNINGCDSLVITTNTLSNIITTNLTSTSCNPLDTGTFVRPLKGYLGCDSIVTTKITLLEKSITRLTATTCDPSAVGEKTVTLKNINGCDSLVITTNTLSNIITTNLTSTSCNPLDTGTFVKPFKGYLGCDSIVTTKITLLEKSITRLTATTCDPSAVGEKTVTLKNINGCDSLVITTNTLSNIITTNLTSTSCNPLDTGTFVKPFKGYLGCDSIVTTKITLLEKSITRLTATTCDPSAVGEKTVTLKNINGCDSLVITTNTLSNIITTNLSSTSCNPLDTGTFIKPLKGYLGCDSIVTTKITLLEKSITRLTATTCDPSAVGEKTVTLKNINGCDSLVITTNTLSNIITTNLSSTSCNPLDTGTFIKPLKGYLGCDSIVTTKITLLEKSITRLTATTCDPSAVGEKTVTLKNINGCDSLVITTNTLSNIITTNLTSTSCNPLDTGTFVKPLKGYLGCDSIVTTKITLLEKSITRLTATTSDPTAVGEKTVPLKNINGCDSLIITTYTLSNPTTITKNLYSTSCNPLDTGTFVKPLKSYLGFDSIVITRITLLEKSITRLIATTCDPSVIGDKTVTLKNINGCDSLVITTYTLSNDDVFYAQKTSCNPAKVGKSTQRFSRVGKCDSVVITLTSLTSASITFDIKPSKSISCNQEDDGELTLSGIKGGLPQYQIAWNTGDTGKVLRNLKTGIYVATVTDGEGCSTFDSFRLGEPIPLSIGAVTNTPQCFTDDFGSILLDSVSGGVAPYRFELSGVQKSVPNLPYTFAKMIVGRYPLTVFDKNNCRSDTVLIVQEGKRLIVELGQDKQIKLGDSISLDVSANATIKSVKWQSETVMPCDTCLSLSVKPIATTRYRVKVTSTEGCQSEDMVTVFIDKNRRVFVPNSFSPNGDKNNDVLMIYGDQAVEKIKTFQIFNRWGSRIHERYNFQINDESAGWDGFFKGQLVQPDVVVYFIEVLFKDGKTEIFQGDVTIME